MYSFALHPERYQPSGTCNFSRIDNKVLYLELENHFTDVDKSVSENIYLDLFIYMLLIIIY